MKRLIKQLHNNVTIEFDSGSFDNWCVYLERHPNKRYAPKDVEYFAHLIELSNKYGYKRIYDDFCKIYKETNKTPMQEVLLMISQIAETYEEDSHEIDIWFTILYAGMIAEENKLNTKLGKRIKGLGLYQLLIEKLPASYVANFSKGRNWRELDRIMLSKGL